MEDRSGSAAPPREESRDQSLSRIGKLSRANLLQCHMHDGTNRCIPSEVAIPKCKLMEVPRSRKQQTQLCSLHTLYDFPV